MWIDTSNIHLPKQMAQEVHYAFIIVVPYWNILMR